MKGLNRTAAWARVLTGIALMGLLAACGGGSQDPQVRTASGLVGGNSGATANSYLGIPYAAAPVGERRWRAPAAPASWSGVRSAQNFGPHCAQPPTPFGAASISEDCLYLNVFTPKGPGPFPVMVWIHGGAFYLGHSNGYNPARLVDQGMVVVTLNYRLGALGFLSHPALSAEQGGASGNYGLMDQQAALRWVRDNIAAFSGNPDNVTLFGESAGGFSVHTHLASADSAGLFHKAIIMSGAYALDGQAPLGAAESIGIALAATSCPAQDIACLRSIPVATLLASQSLAWPSGPIPSVDGRVLTDSVKAHLLAGTYSQVPLIQGTTRDEWTLFVGLDELAAPTIAKPYLGAPLTLADYQDAIIGTFPYLAAQAAGLALGVYPPAAFGNSPSLALGALGTDHLFSCNSRLSSKLQKAGANVYAYEFADTTASPPLPGISFDMGAAHTSELPYLFTMANRPPLTASQSVVANGFVGAFARFARTGDPNTATAPGAWAPWGTQDAVWSFDAIGTRSISDDDFTAAHHCTTVWTPGV